MARSYKQITTAFFTEDVPRIQAAADKLGISRAAFIKTVVLAEAERVLAETDEGSD